MKRYHPHGEASRSTRRWCAWPRTGTCATASSTSRATSAPSPACRRRPCGTPKPAYPPSPPRCSRTSTHDTVDFIDNYDGKYREPLVLPSKFPNLLVNGSDGIAVGMATDIPPHNLREVCDAAHPAHRRPGGQPARAAWRCMPGPDFPTGGIICGRQGILDGYTHRPRQDHAPRPGRHRRGRHAQRRSSSAKCPTSRRATAWPRRSASWSRTSASRASATSATRAASAPASRCGSSSTSSATPTRTWSSTSSTQFSPLQKTVSIILLALVDGRPRYLTLKEMLRGVPAPPRPGDPPPHRVPAARGQAARPRPRRPAHRHLVAGRGDRASAARRRAATEAKRPLAGHGGRRPPCWAGPWARRTSPPCSARSACTTGYRMTEAQAEAVVRMQLGQLAALERDEILKEYNDLREQDRRLRAAAERASATSSR